MLLLVLRGGQVGQKSHVLDASLIFLLHSGKWGYQCFVSCFGQSQLLLFSLLNSMESLGTSPVSLSSLAAVVALLSLPLAPLRSWRPKAGEYEGKLREQKEPPVTSSLFSCTVAF